MPMFHSPLPFNLHDHLEPLRIVVKILKQSVRVPIDYGKNSVEQFNPLSREQQRYMYRRQTLDGRLIP